MRAWRFPGAESIGVTVIIACLSVVLAGVSGAQDSAAVSVAKTTDWSRQDFIRAESARLGSTICLPRGDFPGGTGVSALTACELWRVPKPTYDDASGTVVGPGNWHGVIEADPKSGATTLTFVLPATDVPGAGAGRFLIQCRTGKLHAFVEAQQPLNLGNGDNVTVLFGTDALEGQQWFAASDSTTLVVSGDQKRVRSFVGKVANYSRLTIQARPHQAEPRTLMFDLAGIEVVSAQLLAGCK